MFDSAKLKIARAIHHIADLERQLTAFTRANFDTSVRHLDGGGLTITLTVLDPPPAIALTIGDAIHNLRTSLDHMIHEAAGPGGQHNQLYFPTGRNRQSYEGTCKGMKAPNATLKTLLESLEAFPGGSGEFLYIVHSLDRADKHQVLTPVVHTPGIDELVLVMEGGKTRRPLSDLYGSAPRISGGETFTISGAPADWTLAFKNNAEISPHILFGDIEFVQGKAILPTLRQLRDAVANTINIVESAIRLQVASSVVQGVH